MLTSRSNPLLSRRILREKCKIERCPRTKRLGTCGMSNFCKVHEVFIFLVKLKYSMKKLFGNLSSGFTVLQRESGNYFSLKDLCNFMNFLMIPYLLDDVQNVFEVLGKKHGNKNITVIKIDDIKKTMKSKEYREIVDVEIRIILEVISSSIKINGIKSVIANLDLDKDGTFDVNDFIRTFRIRETQSFLFFMHVFKQNFSTIPKFIALFPENNNELYLNLSEINANSGLNHFFSEKKIATIDDEVHEKKIEYFNKQRSNMLEELRIKLKQTYINFEDAFYNIANSNSEIGYFQIQRALKDNYFPHDENICRAVISSISQAATINLQNFKEFWFMRDNICQYNACIKSNAINELYCESHISINKRKALVLLEKIKTKTFQ